MRNLFIIAMILFFANGFAQSKSVETDPRDRKSRELMELAVEYFKKNDFNKSTQLLFEAKELAEETNNYELTAKIYGSLSHQYTQLNLNDKAKEYLDKAIVQINKMPEGNAKKLYKGLSYLELGNIVFDEKKYPEANRYYKKSLEEFQSVSSVSAIPVYHYRRSLYNIGNSYIFINKNDSAELFLKQSLVIKDAENKELDLFINKALSGIYSKNGDYKRAIDSLQKILISKDLKNTRLESDVYQSLAENYRLAGDNDRSVFYNEKYLELSNSNKEKEYKAINSAISEEQKDYRNAISNADSNTKLIAVISTVFLALLLLLIVFILQRRQKEKKAFELLIDNLKKNQMVSETDKTEPEIKTERITIPELAEKELLEKLAKFEESGKFTNPKLNISNLAVSLKTNTSYLSEVINNQKGKNFNAYINELRIAYICKKIYNNKAYQNYKISYLAQESGFTSHSSFTTVFKNITGISPSVFLREASKRNHGKEH
ncbi:helix-turn-helix domain-containing protein [Epilithonimonas mollis]|uniref:AraC-type DNA-binding protein n=1 Tax=Epilithonimonas mollis TaxID=216903 RepID=A0A1M6P416_9FLAO|nr:helix-turn-helix domain-containing protein [Epilithonimonas mollis]SHK02661.1 AraC-type DNA-binding protein [Epilithonimonas mollis]